jgi:hypothetical protein
MSWFQGDGAAVCHYGRDPATGDWLIHFGRGYDPTRCFSKESLRKELYHLRKQYTVMTTKKFIVARVKGEVVERKTKADR